MQSVTWLWKTNIKCDRARFYLELCFAKIGLYLAIYMVLCVFNKVIVFVSKQICNKISCNHFVNKRLKYATVAGSFVVWGVKTTWLQSPSFFYFFLGGWNQAPREPKSAKNYGFLRCFLVLRKSLKVASTPALKRPSCELFGALGPQQMHFTCICKVIFCL